MRNVSLSGKLSKVCFGRSRSLATLVFALIAALAIPAIAADSRAVRTRVAPVYPELARRLKITGQVTVRVTVDPAGNVTEAKATSGNRMLTLAAEDAVRKWHFAPAEAVSTIDVSVEFMASN